MNEMMQFPFCFICFADLKKQLLKVKIKEVKRGRGRRKKEDYDQLKTLVNKKGESSVKLLMSYLLDTRARTYDGVLKDILKKLCGGVHVRDHDNCSKVLRLCQKCEGLGARILELHLELEKVQMRIVHQVMSVREEVLKCSGWLGGVGNGPGTSGVGVEAEECFQQFSNRFCDGDSSQKGRTLFETLKAFQTAVFEQDKDSIRIPLVYLDKYKVTIPRENNLASFPEEDIITPDDPRPYVVKTEPEHIFYPEDTDDDNDDLFDNFPSGAPGFPSEVEGDSTTCLFNNDETFEEDSSPCHQYQILETSEIGDGTTEHIKVEIEEEQRINYNSRTRRTSAKIANLRLTEINLKIKKERNSDEILLGGHHRPKLKRSLKNVKSTRARGKVATSGRNPEESESKNKFKKTPNPKMKRVSMRYRCESCSFNCSYASRLEQHLREHETEREEKTFHCDQDQCTTHEGFSNQQHYTIHQERHRGRHKLKCDVCGGFIEAFELPSHLKTHVEEVFPCSHCSHWSSSRDKQLYHRSVYHVGVNHSCDICGRSFDTKKMLVDHLGKAHDKAVEKLRCDIEGCGKTFLMPGTLYLHKISHTNRFSCKICFLRFSCQGNLERHQRIHSGEYPFKCDQCPEAFRYPGLLKSHLIRDHDAPKLDCSICAKSFATKASLQYHTAMEHDGETAKFCPICNKKCGNTTKYNAHLNSHSKEKNYVCEECGKSFQTQGKYRIHKPIHGEKTEKCPHCSKVFAQRKVLLQHIRIHTGEKKYACEHCGKGFSQSGPRNKHRRTCQLLQQKEKSL